jgi:hypothetical protein
MRIHKGLSLTGLLLAVSSAPAWVDGKVWMEHPPRSARNRSIWSLKHICESPPSYGLPKRGRRDPTRHFARVHHGLGSVCQSKESREPTASMIR